MADDALLVELLRHGVFGRVTHQAARQADFIHHLIAHIDAGGAADTFILQAFANIDASRANHHALAAIDTVTQPGGFGINAFFARPTVFTARFVVADD